MTDNDEQALLNAISASIRREAEAAFEKLLQRIRQGEAPQDAIAAVTQEFNGAYAQELADAFSAILSETVGVPEVKAWPIGDVALSERLYAHQRDVNASVARIIREHVQGFVQARELAMRIYEGYQYKNDPLAVTAKLPMYMRRAVADPMIGQSYSQLIARIQATQLKTPALKASYLQALDALEKGAGFDRLSRQLRIAWFERNRYFANRIAQTELHRSYETQKASEMMGDDALSWVQVRMSNTHPKVDICDFHARANLYGMGPGIYPKAKAPRPPFHPFCRCITAPRYDLDGKSRQIKNADRAFMRQLPENDQRLIAGSWDRLRRFRGGESLEAIHNSSARKQYRLKRVGDGH